MPFIEHERGRAYYRHWAAVGGADTSLDLDRDILSSDPFHLDSLENDPLASVDADGASLTRELARSAGLGIDRGTPGPVVVSALRTSRDGVFAIGNLLHSVGPAPARARPESRCASGWQGDRSQDAAVAGVAGIKAVCVVL